MKRLVGDGRADEERAGARGRRERAADARDRLAARPLSATGETVSTELSTLKEERDVIRTRVGDMLEQLEALNL